MNIIMLVIIVILFIYIVVNSYYVKKTKCELKQVKEYNKTLSDLNDSIRIFKHDFSNILTVIGGYIKSNDTVGLEKYYLNLIEDFNKVNNLSTLNPDIINNPAVYAIIANKYQKAYENDIDFNLDIFIDFNKINMSVYEFTRILRNTYG